jgi:formate dehydrogenase (coenzyme F420) beta subunit
VTILTQLKEQIAAQLPQLDMVIGWEQGYDPLHATPLFITAPKDLERLLLGPLTLHNTATYLTGLKDKKVGILVKGCDSRAVVQLQQEGLINRENVVVFGFPCDGVVDLVKIRRILGGTGRVTGLKISPTTLGVEHDGTATQIPLADVLADKCGRCRFPNALVHDYFAGKPREPHADEDDYGDVATFEARPLQDRLLHWQEEMGRCLRCYACRNACPMCVCRDHCLAQSRDPHWLTQDDQVREKWMFQVIHATHLAGRCVECGECQRACPVDIPVLALKRKLNREIKDLFNYDAGIDPAAIPPLLSFQLEEENINERGW